MAFVLDAAVVACSARPEESLENLIAEVGSPQWGRLKPGLKPAAGFMPPVRLSNLCN